MAQIVARPRNGYLHQDPQLDPNETLRGAAEAAFAELHRLHRELDKVFDLMGTAEGDALDKLLEKQSKLETQMEAAGSTVLWRLVHAVDLMRAVVLPGGPPFTLAFFVNDDMDRVENYDTMDLAIFRAEEIKRSFLAEQWKEE